MLGKQYGSKVGKRGREGGQFTYGEKKYTPVARGDFKPTQSTSILSGDEPTYANKHGRVVA